MEPQKKIFLKYFIIPFAALMLLYYGVAWGVSSKIFHQNPPEPETLLKYTVSRVADMAGFEWLSFSLPEEFREKILHDVPDYPHSVPIYFYHYILDYAGADHEPPHKTIFYVAFPWYLLAALIICKLYETYKLSTIPKTPEAKRGDVYIRGVRRVDPSSFCKMIKKAVLDPIASVMTDGGELLFSSNRLREHVAIFGASGTGKSQFLLAFLASFFSNKTAEIRAIIIDRKGEFWAYFGDDRQDIIFNPFDCRSQKWSLFNELDIPEDFAEEPPDVRAVAKILFPGNKKDPFWENAAADVFCSAVAVCIRRGTTTNKDLVNFCNSSAAEIIRAFRDLPIGLAAGRVLGDDPSSLTAGSILSTLKTGIHPLAVCEDGDFSVKDWIHNGTGSLYLSSAGKNDTVFIPVLTILFDMIGREVKELADSGSGGVKYLFVIDELAAYPKLNTLHFLVAEARSKGVSVVIATQTIQKVLQVYGEKEGRDVLGNTKTKVIFRTIEADDARYLSKTIGAGELQRTQRAENENASTVFGRVDGREGTTKTKQIVNEAVFLTGDLQTLDTGNAIVIHPAAGEAVAKLKFDPFRGEKRGIEFDPVKEKTVSARDFGEIEKQRAAAEAEKKKAEEKKKEEEAARKAAEEEEKRKQEEAAAIGELKRKIASGELDKEEEEAEMEYWPKETQPEDGKSDGDQDGDYLILG